MALALMTSCGGGNDEATFFEYANEKFADLQMLRYEVKGWESLSLPQKELVYYLSEAALHGRDILYDQNGRYNLRIRSLMESIYTNDGVDHDTDDFKALEVYLKRIWFSNGIHHHYGELKFLPAFSQEWLRAAMETEPEQLPYAFEGQTIDELCAELILEHFDDLFGFSLAEKTVVDVYADELFADGFDQKGSDYRRVDAA